MKNLKEYLDYLNQMIKEDPRILEYPLVTASDDEGNEFHPVFTYPSLAHTPDPKKHSISPYDIKMFHDETHSDFDKTVHCTANEHNVIILN
jgi:hypothetical protein